MKTFIYPTVAVLLLITVSCRTGSDNLKHSLQPSAITKGRWLIQDDDGDIEGYVERDIIDPRRTMVYDKKHNLKGWYQQSAIDPRRQVFTKRKK